MTITEEIITSPGKYVEKLELLHNVGGDENNAVTLENSLAISETVKHRVSTWPSNSTPSYRLKRHEYIHPKTKRKACTWMFTADLSTKPKKSNTSNVQQQMDGWIKRMQ